MKIISLIVGFTLSLAAATADTIDGYTFELNGQPLDPGLLYVSGGVLSPGDVVYIGDIPLCLDEPGLYDFRLKDGMVWRVLQGGQLVVVACEISFERDDSLPSKKWKVKNPLAGMNDSALKGLRGVSIDLWSDEISRQLARLDTRHVCLRLQYGAIEERVPPVPDTVRTLILYSLPWSSKDMSGFSRLKRLRLLSLDETWPWQFDFAALKGLPLEYLSLPRTDNPANVEVLSTFRDLKTLVANRCSFMGDGRWVANLTNLQVLYASYVESASPDVKAPPLDLAALAGLTKLEGLHAQGSSVRSLPSTLMPALKRVSLLRSEVPKEAVDAFAKANPQAAISRSMNAQLAEQLAQADRVRVRTGGVCHRREGDERIIHESRDQKTITELAAHFVVDESVSDGNCMCCGNPTFEFYEKDKIVATIAFHHGRSIRWADGTWPCDGMLVEQSSSYLVNWLEEQGFTRAKIESLRKTAAPE